jgi:hypothetical protein
MKRQLTIEEIKEKLMWFHGEEFEKYPFIDSKQSKKKLNSQR